MFIFKGKETCGVSSRLSTSNYTYKANNSNVGPANQDLSPEPGVLRSVDRLSCSHWSMVSLERRRPVKTPKHMHARARVFSVQPPPPVFQNLTSPRPPLYTRCPIPPPRPAHHRAMFGNMLFCTVRCCLFALPRVSFRKTSTASPM